jgi:hypothetical protein
MGRRTGILGAALVIAGAAAGARGEAWLVKDGRPQAEIVIAAPALPVVKLAADELQTNILKMTGALLPITSQPGQQVPVKVYVGRSPHTDALNVTDEGLQHGAFRMQSGTNWLALVGIDRRFEFKGPCLTNSGDKARVVAAWDKATGATWEYPYPQLWKSYNRTLDIWEQDERGSFNAVCAFLAMQGMRWYLPDALGEVVPKKATIDLPAVNKTVRPDFALRYPYIYGRRFGLAGASCDEVLWQMRMGFDQAPDLIGIGYIAHGIPLVISRDEVKKAHPEYYALNNGVRQNGDRIKACLSSEGLFQENVKFIRAVFDIFDAPMMSVMPTDGFTAACQCDLCKDKMTPERGWMGQYSNYVWDYVNRVAIEVYKTHPNKKIVGMAYTTYLLPPTKIQKFSPNLVVCMAQNRGDLSKSPAMRKAFDEAQARYVELLPAGTKQFCTYDYYRHAVPGKIWRSLPAFYPHAVADDMRHLKDFSFGEYVEVHREKGLNGYAATALNLYLTGRYWWDAGLDVNAVLDEYYTLFYGPARDEMKAFIEYSEANWRDMSQSIEKIDRCFALLAEAQARAPADSVYGQRIGLIADYLQPMKALQAELAKGREGVPSIEAVVRDEKTITLDGKLDDAFWRDVPSCEFKELISGQSPPVRSSFKVAWAGDSLYLGIRCEEPDMKHLVVGATKNEDTSVWNGDCIEIFLETQTHSYYQLSLSPSGALLDLDRKEGLKTLWSSDAKVAARTGDDGWSLEVRIPVAGEMQGDIDPLNGVAGRKPDAKGPWFINICRQRVRGGVKAYSAFSPTGKSGFAQPMKFGQLDVK